MDDPAPEDDPAPVDDPASLDALGAGGGNQAQGKEGLSLQKHFLQKHFPNKEANTKVFFFINIF